MKSVFKVTLSQGVTKHKVIFKMTRCEKMEEHYKNIKNLKTNVGKVNVNTHIPPIKKHVIYTYPTHVCK
jgi:hypothetical protein